MEINQESKKVDPYSCVIKTFVGQPPQLKTVGHFPRETYGHVFFFLKEENGRIEGSVHSTRYRLFPIAAGLEILQLLTFESTRFVMHQEMKDFMASLYSCDYKPQEITNSEDEKNEDIIFIEDEDEEHSEEVKLKMERKKPTAILETSTETSDNKICR